MIDVSIMIIIFFVSKMIDFCLAGRSRARKNDDLGWGKKCGWKYWIFGSKKMGRHRMASKINARFKYEKISWRKKVGLGNFLVGHMWKHSMWTSNKREREREKRKEKEKKQQEKEKSIKAESIKAYKHTSMKANSKKSKRIIFWLQDTKRKTRFFWFNSKKSTQIQD